MYGINWQTFIEERIGSPLRKPVMFAWVHALLGPVKVLHSDFLNFKVATERHVQTTGQVCILRYWLNELFDVTERRFVIEDYLNTEPILIWGESFNDPIYLPQFLSSKAYDFTVIAPCDAYASKVLIKGFLDKYKLAGKRYKLVFKDELGNHCSIVGLPPFEDF